MRIGLFGGSFNPIHKGHLQLAEELRHRYSLDEVWFVVAKQNPLKDREPLSTEHRVTMAELAVASEPCFQVCSLECERPSPSYTYDTVQELQQEHPDKEFFLLVGSDCLEGLEKWYKVRELLTIIPLYIVQRPGSLEDTFPPSLEGVGEVHFLDIAALPISASAVRKNIKEKNLVDDMVPPKVLDYISENNLYSVV